MSITANASQRPAWDREMAVEMVGTALSCPAESMEY
jgi:hypothetical protein